MRTFVRWLVAVAVLGGFGAQVFAQKSGEIEIRQGVVEQIAATQIQSNHHRGVGAVVGGLGGLGIGSLIGGGTGRDVAMVVGTIGVNGCNKRATYVVVCPDDGSGNCFAADGQR